MANKPSKGQEKLLRSILNRRNLPTKDDVFNIYVNHVVKERCKEIIVSPQKRWRHEKGYNTLYQASRIWYASALGSLIIKGKINLVL